MRDVHIHSYKVCTLFYSCKSTVLQQCGLAYLSFRRTMSRCAEQVAFCIVRSDVTTLISRDVDDSVQVRLETWKEVKNRIIYRYM